MKPRWHISRDADGLTLSRHARARFDVAATAEFPLLRMLPLAQMIRQDLWRALQTLRGFAPVVDIRRWGGGLRVTAGGSVVGNYPKATTKARIDLLLAEPRNRARWERCARLTSGKDLV